MDKAAFKDALKGLAAETSVSAGDAVRQCLKVAADSALHGPARGIKPLRNLLAERSAEMRGCRPELAPLDNLLTRWQEDLGALSDSDLEDWRWQAADAAMALLDEYQTAVRHLALNAREVVPDGSSVLTHGPSSIIREIFSALAERNVRAMVTECRPRLNGRAIARKLAGWGIPTTLVTDAQMGAAVNDADCVMVGAEGIRADGAVVNRIGTYLLALAAHDRGIPFYVCCETFKRHRADAAQPVVREDDPDELGVTPVPGLVVRNVAVDVTPGWLVTAWINETGLASLQED